MDIAVITGASSGIGREFVLAVDREAKFDEIWVVARRAALLEDLRSQVSAPLRILALDLEKEESFEEYSSALSSAGANACWLVNAAGFGVYGDFEEVSLKKQMRMIDLNVKALVTITNLTIPYMKAGSHIIELGSASVFNPLPYFNIYASTKAFIRHYSRALYYELRPRGISVTVVCPYWVKTEFLDNATSEGARHIPRSYMFMSEAGDVAAKAMRDARKGKPLCVHGAFTRTQHIASKLLPHSLLIRIWLRMLT